jgi:hypothetical protein
MRLRRFAVAGERFHGQALEHRLGAEQDPLVDQRLRVLTADARRNLAGSHERFRNPRGQREPAFLPQRRQHLPCRGFRVGIALRIQPADQIRAHGFRCAPLIRIQRTIEAILNLGHIGPTHRGTSTSGRVVCLQ